MNYNRINNITGWLVCIIACSVYIMTMEATGSLWDCGEFASSAYKLQVPHSPGAPLFVLIGRLFMAPFDAKHAASGINLMSALSSGFTILFLFWTITHFAKKLVVRAGGLLNNVGIMGIMGAGVVGALAYTFSDSFWYSAVEGEVYALSSFFTGLLFWLMLKWENNVTEEQAQGINGHFTKADRWIILIFFLMGLSIGVHLLNLLTIPAIVMIYFFKRYRVTKWRTFFAFIVGCIITGFMQKALVQWTVKAAGNLDILFKNNFHMPFFSGFGFFFVGIVALILIGISFKENVTTKMKLTLWLALFLAFLIFPGILYTGSDSVGGMIFGRIVLITAAVIGFYFVKLPNLRFLKLSLWCFLFITFGCFAAYFTTLVRSNANVALDMNEVDNPVNFLSYLSREQYGDWPILYGQDFTDDIIDTKTSDKYVKGADSYIQSGKKLDGYVYPEGATHVFPRMWDQSNDQGRADYYAGWMGLAQDNSGNYKKDADGNYLREDGEPAKPSMGENVAFFAAYQINWMYLRYFLWNFAGKQNDVQGVYMSSVRDGNWKTGIGFFDNMRLGNQDTLPDSIKNSKANNKLFALPLILGILGFIFQYQKDRRDALVTALLFVFTGLAIAFYLNMAGNQPRERDYAFVGSFYAFAIWIGLGVLFVIDALLRPMKNIRTATIAASLLCLLAVPVLMASQEWDDHDRSRKLLARDLATDYLESCAPNAILITFGDNDTYPLWYAQEVEGIRQDIRVINASLLGTDWYINQLRYKVNQSDPIDLVWTPAQIEGSNRDVVYNAPLEGIDPNKPMDLLTMLRDYAGSDDPKKGRQRETGENINIFPSKIITIPVDKNVVANNGTVNAGDSVLSSVQFTIPKSALYKNDGAILNIIAANNWKRPIYFTSPYNELGFVNFLRQDGLSYRLVPVDNGEVNKDWVMNKMLSKFVFGNADKAGVYFDEENRRHLNSIRLAYAQAAGNLADAGRKEDAIKLLHRCDNMMLESNMPYGMVSRSQQQNQISLQFMYSAFRAGDKQLAEKISSALKKDMQQQAQYYQSLPDGKRTSVILEEEARNDRLYKGLQQLENQFKNPQPPNQETGTPVTTQPVAPRTDTAKP